jgi:release factor glutamine methyltransferase
MQDAQERLRNANIPNPSLDAGVLLAYMLGVGREKLFLIDEIDDEDAARFDELIEKRASGICAAYLVGHKEFFGLDFLVTPDVLVPRPETEALVENIISHKGTKDTKVLDLCTGTGAIAIALKHEMPDWEVWATDISEEALAVAKKNCINILGSETAICFLRGDLYNAFVPSCTLCETFTIIAANPPYVPDADIADLAPEVRNEPRIALAGGGDGLAIIRRIVEGAPAHLEAGGRIFLEADPRQMEAIAALLAEHGFSGIEIVKDIAGNGRVIGARRSGI